jgi:HD-GYP domain-containing protein (c-di-GMP phosphodiesterase class II)
LNHQAFSPSPPHNGKLISCNASALCYNFYVPKKYNYNKLVSNILTMPDGKTVNDEYVNIILNENISVFCENKKEQIFRLMSFKAIYEKNKNFWQKNDNWEFFFTRETLDKLREKKFVIPDDIESEDTDNVPLEIPVVREFGAEYETIAAMSNTEKIKYLHDIKNRMDTLVSISNKSKTTKALVDTTRDAVMVNHSALENVFDLGDVEAKRATNSFVITTQEMVKSNALLISKNIFDNLLMSRLVEKSNGTIVQHMTRVYLNGIAFLAYYNNFVSNRISVINMRKTLNAKYRQYYQNLLPHISTDDIVLERVFQKGMIPIPPDLFVKWAVGFLIHDIGKAAAIEYHEGESSYDRYIVMEHVKLGYNSIMKKTNYPKEAALITGYHHEYYGNPEGYGYFRESLNNFRKTNQHAKQDYCMTFDLDSMMDYKALSYFPAKVLEVVDVYDSITDPNRTYRKALSSNEALALIREEFITKKLKIDPILFELFTGFIHEKKESNDKD